MEQINCLLRYNNIGGKNYEYKNKEIDEVR